MRTPRAHFLSALACAFLCGLLAAPAHAAFPGRNGKIAFTTAFTQLDLINPDGSGRASFSSASAFLREPAWSPDGTKIAFSRAAFPDGSNFEIFVMNADGSDPTQLTFFAGADADPAWSPDGRSLVFTRVVDDRTCGGFVDCGEELFTMRADGSEVHRLTDNNTFDQDPAWSPDGRRIVFSRFGACSATPGDCSWDLVLIDPDGSDETTLLSDGESNRFPNWSPSGEEIAFSSTLKACCVGEIYRIHADGSGQTQVTRHTSARDPWIISVEPAWSPDGAQIAFNALYAGSNSEIHVVNADGTGARRLTDDPAFQNDPDWQPLNRPPQCSGITASPFELRPPNRHFHGVSVSGGSDPDGDAVTLEVTGVTQDEPVRGRGDGTAPDARPGSGPDDVRLRAERNPFGDGRVYHITVQASDGRGGTCEGDATVGVRRHKKRAAVDSAPPAFDSFGR